MSSSDEEFQDENIAPVRTKSSRPKKAMAKSIFNIDSDEDIVDLSRDDNADSDFEPEEAPKKTKKPATAAIAKKATKAKAPAKKKPLKSVENEMDLDVSDSDTDAGISAPSVKPKSNASSQYQKLSQLEHVLKRPDTYIGSVEHTESSMWVFDPNSSTMVYKSVSIVPGLYKIFDEILVNAADNKIRDPNMDALIVDINVESNTISIYNNGRGIPVEIHDKEKMYIPEMIFGNLLTSSNYDDDEKKVTGGRNGYGAKLCNIFSTEFTVETADKTNKLKYVQTWSDNMSKVGKPKITALKKDEEFTRITFKPDLKLFKMDKIDDDLLGVMMRRVYDLAGSVTGIKVTLNKQRLKIKNFKGYVEMFVKALQEQGNKANSPDAAGEENGNGTLLLPPPTEQKSTVVYERLNDRWEIAFAVSDGSSFNQVSFVNSIATTSGGTHVNYIADQLVTKISELVKKRNKSAPVKPFQIKNNMFVFINCLIENPAFTSQTKEQLTTKVSSFGSKCTLSDDFMKKVLKTSIVENVMDIATRNADRDLKKTDGGKKRRITGFVKLEDANKAGTREGHKCTLILTEGDSAMTLAVAGLAVVGRDYYGVFPLRGKMLNVREASHDQIMKNAEIQAIKQIMGLQHKKHYTSTEGLRYGHIMIMTDQDHDGSHIKGLIINFLQSSFPGLLEIPGFLIEFITPIVKVSIMRGKKIDRVIPFYTMPQYEVWRDTEGKTCVWKQKYYKGLGTSEPNREGREYFSQLDQHLKKFHQLQEGDVGLIELAFAKKNADARKDWLRAFKPGTHLDPDLTEIPISDFINKELILFSMADNVRSIPSVLDGLKPGQRKILYGCFRRNLSTDIKVVQLGGYVSEYTGYHHGEQSLYQTIIGLAQDFVGSNNLYFLMPNGSFGSRATGGKDASAPRYIFTELNKLTRKLFNPSDDLLYKYLDDDDTTVEPEWYLPIIPTLLVNGTEGIGTGWSTNIPSFNPADLVDNIKRLMNGEEMVPMTPWFRGWTGTVERVSNDKFTVRGIVNQRDENTVEITELPVRMWTQTMKEFLLDAIVKDKRDKKDPGWIEDFTEEHGVGIKFVVQMTKSQMEAALAAGLYNRFKLTSTISLSNMIAFDPQGRIKKYDNVEQILSEFYYVRLEYYQKRKDNMVGQLRNQLEKLSQQARFVKMIIGGQLKVSNKRKNTLISELEDLNFPKIAKDGSLVYVGQEDPDESMVVDELSVLAEEEGDPEAVALQAEQTINKPQPASYEYLLGMAIWSLTRERYERLIKDRDNKESELNGLLKKSAKDLWSTDLEDFMKGWNEFLEEDTEKRESMIPDKKKSKGKKRAKKSNDDDDDDDFKPGVAKKKVKTTAAAVKAEKPEKKLKQSTLAFADNNAESEVKFGSGIGSSVFGSPTGQKTKAKQTDIYDRSGEDLLGEIISDFSKPATKFVSKPTSKPAKSSIFGGGVFSFSDEEDDDVKPTTSKAVKTTRSTAKSTTTKTTSAATKTKSNPKPKPKVKSKPKILDDDSENEAGDLGVESTQVRSPSAARKPRRAAATKKSYALVLSDEDSVVKDTDEEDDDEEGGASGYMSISDEE